MHKKVTPLRQQEGNQNRRNNDCGKKTRKVWTKLFGVLPQTRHHFLSLFSLHLWTAQRSSLDGLTAHFLQVRQKYTVPLDKHI